MHEGGREMTALVDYSVNYRALEFLFHISGKDVVQDCALLLAMNVAQYRSIYGEVPFENMLHALGDNPPNQAQAEVMSEGIKILCYMLAPRVIQGSGTKN